MSPSVVAALAALRSAADLIEVAVADTEHAPVSIVLVRDASSGRIHRRARVQGIPGLMAYEGDNADDAGVFEVIPDLSTLSDEAALCRRCFGDLDDASPEVERG